MYTKPWGHNDYPLELWLGRVIVDQPLTDQVLRMKASLPPFEIYYLFHIDSFRQSLSSTLSHTVFALNGAPKGRPQ